MSDYKLSERDRSTLQFKVTSKLREVILSGEFEPGERLVQEEWAEKLGVSRMPIREALQQLEVEGLVKIEPRRGAIVTPISTEDIKEIYFLRSLLEGEAVKMSLSNLTEEDVIQLESLYNEMIALEKNDLDVQTFTELNKQFHKIMRSRCEWRRIHQIIDALWVGIPAYTPGLLSSQIDYANKEHRIMLDAINAGDEKQLEEITKQHILRTRDALIEMIEKR